MNNNNRYIILCFIFVIILVCTLVGYGIYINTASTAHVEKLSDAQYARVGVVKTSYQEITPTIYIPSFSLTSVWMLDVYIKLDGTLSALYVQPGDKVKKGQLIGEITNDELPSQILQAEGNISGSQAGYIRWSNTARRYQLLTESGAISQQQLEEAIANRDAAASEVASAEAQRNQLVSRLKNQKIFAPQNGDVLKTYHAPGMYLGTGQAVIMLGDFSTLEARLTMSSNELEELLRIPDKFKLAIPNNQVVEKAYAANFSSSNAALEFDFDIFPDKIEPALSIPSQYRSVLWQINNKTIMLEPGSYYQVKIYSAGTRRALAIPKEALLKKSDTVVFVVSNNRLEQRHIRTGIQDDKLIEVLEGLNEGDAVVISGKAGLTVGTRVQVVY